jgi:DNA-directed RNA polymerase specialized sigma24 family protein
MCASHEFSEQMLAEQLAARDPAAWDEFLSRYKDRIQGFIRTTLLGPTRRHRADLIEDVLQDVWVALLEKDGAKCREFDPDRGSLDTFLTGLVCLQVYRRFLRTNQAHVRAREESLSDAFQPADYRVIPGEFRPLLADLRTRLSPTLWRYLVKFLVGRRSPKTAAHRQQRHRLLKVLLAFLDFPPKESQSGGRINKMDKMANRGVALGRRRADRAGLAVTTPATKQLTP